MHKLPPIFFPNLGGFKRFSQDANISPNVSISSQRCLLEASTNKLAECSAFRDFRTQFGFRQSRICTECATKSLGEAIHQADVINVS